ncbi:MULTISPECIES: hypothetical protein [unclassified Streptomyces]|uniref:hypothetical protein n=1 Tax=unclassified Streptomyces TaxID=2593676 RepID=UPI002B1D152A|nr:MULTISPECIES: hypothetical protein [unclassified Streptomyces]
MQRQIWRVEDTHAARSRPATRIRWDERTRSYLERRTKQGMSKREINRCLKRYVAREIYRHIRLTAAIPAPLSAT